MNLLVIIVVLALVVLVVSAPLRAARRGEASSASELRELEAARDAKYREIRDAELDHRMGKLSDEDFQALEAGLRAEAIVILRAIDRLRGGADGAGGEAPARGPEELDARPRAPGALPPRPAASRSSGRAD